MSVRWARECLFRAMRIDSQNLCSKLWFGRIKHSLDYFVMQSKSLVLKKIYSIAIAVHSRICRRAFHGKFNKHKLFRATFSYAFGAVLHIAMQATRWSVRKKKPHHRPQWYDNIEMAGLNLMLMSSPILIFVFIQQYRDMDESIKRNCQSAARVFRYFFFLLFVLCVRIVE